MFARNLSLRAFVGRVSRRFVEERFDQISASLAFTTLLSLVPLVAIVLGLMSLLPVFYGMVEQLDHFALRGLLPKHYAGMIIAYVLEFSQKAANVTLVGLLVLVATVFLLLQTIERAFNHVWRVTENRPWWRRLRLYAAVLVLWPLAVTCVITTISYAVTMSLGLVEEQPWLRGMLFKASGMLPAISLVEICSTRSAGWPTSASSALKFGCRSRRVTDTPLTMTAALAPTPCERLSRM